MTSKLISSDILGKTICEALDIDCTIVRRLVLDITMGIVIKVYIEMFGNEKLLDIDWSLLDGVEISVLDDKGINDREKD